MTKRLLTALPVTGGLLLTGCAATQSATTGEPCGPRRSGRRQRPTGSEPVSALGSSPLVAPVFTAEGDVDVYVPEGE
jgi:hypothetical protein